MLKTVSKSEIQKTAEENGNFIRKKLQIKLKVNQNNSSIVINAREFDDVVSNTVEVLKESYILPEKRQRINDELRLI